MMSTEEEVEKLYYCMKNGAKNFLVKPIRRHVSLPLPRIYPLILEYRHPKNVYRWRKWTTQKIV